ncbi:MAG: LPS-assembly protein LptD, partial [Erythrobacter sp.]
MSGGTRGSARFAARLGWRAAARASVCPFAGLLIALTAAPASAADDPAPTDDLAKAMAGEVIDFEAEQLSYDNEADIVTARGNVVLRSKDRSVRANEVTWDRGAGSIIASGNVRLVDESGNQLFTETIELTDQFEAGAMA